MSKGIAVQFVKRFAGVDDLKAQQKKVGDTAVLERDGRYIYYLITKERYYWKPTDQTLEKSLIAMRDHAITNNVKRISMPKIGCGTACYETTTWSLRLPLPKSQPASMANLHRFR